MRKSTILILTGTLLSLIAIPLMATPATTESSLGSVFDFAFGSASALQIGGFTALFVLILLWLANQIGASFSSLLDSKRGAQAFSVIAAIVFVIAAIVSFEGPMMISEATKRLGHQYEIGGGPITIGVIAILSSLLSLVGSYANFKGEETSALDETPHEIYGKETANEEEEKERMMAEEGTDPTTQESPPSAPVVTEAPPPQKKRLDDMQSIKLLLEYKKLLDEGILTSEEYEQKKKELLK